MEFSLHYTIYQLAPAVSDCEVIEGELLAHNKSGKLYGGVELFIGLFSVQVQLTSMHPTVEPQFC